MRTWDPKPRWGRRIPLASTRIPLASTQTPLASTRTPLASTRTPLASTRAPLASTRDNHREHRSGQSGCVRGTRNPGGGVGPL
eukprot:1092193-Prorocentrum_minimum.AAC.7